MAASSFLTRVESYRDPKALWPLAGLASVMAHGVLLLGLRPWVITAQLPPELAATPLPIQLLADASPAVASEGSAEAEASPSTSAPSTAVPVTPPAAEALNPTEANPNSPTPPLPATPLPGWASPSPRERPPFPTVDAPSRPVPSEVNPVSPPPGSPTVPSVQSAPISPLEPPSLESPSVESPPLEPAPEILSPEAGGLEPSLDTAPVNPVLPRVEPPPLTVPPAGEVPAGAAESPAPLADGATGQISPMGVQPAAFGRDFPEVAPRLLSNASISVQPWLSVCGLGNVGAIASPGLRARVQLHLHVQPSGEISLAQVVQSSGNPAVDNLVSCMVQRQLRLSPAMVAGEPFFTDAYVLETQVQF